MDDEDDYLPRTPKSPRRIALQACIGTYGGEDDEEDQKRRKRVMTKTQLVKRLRLSLHDWHIKRSRMDRRTTARESTIALLKKLRHDQTASSKCPGMARVATAEMAVDPITRERLPREPSERIFSFRRGSTIARVDAAALIDYILTTGDYSDPESRLPFDECALARLDQIGSHLGKPSVLKARDQLEAKFAERQFLRDALCGLERVCGESVTQMFELVEKVNENEVSMDDAEMRLLTFIVPEFQSNLAQLADADRMYAKHSAMQFEAFLRGPPNRPMKKTPIHQLVIELFKGAVSEAVRE